jgi:Mn-containing catalase
MFLRVEKLLCELPEASQPDPVAAQVVQELMGGQCGEMSTLMNYTFQSFNFRGKKEAKPFYDLLASITAEEMGHIELVANTVNGLLQGAAPRVEGKPESAPLKGMYDTGLPHHFLRGGQSSLPTNALGMPWNGDYVYNSGDLMLDMLHNFFLESGARISKLRVYESTDNPIARELCGFLLVRGGVHQLTWTKALEKLTGVEVSKMLNIPRINLAEIPEAQKWMAIGEHTRLYRFSPDDYRDIGAVFNGTHPEDGSELYVSEDFPTGGAVPPGEPEPQVFAPGYHPEELVEIAQRLLKNANAEPIKVNGRSSKASTSATVTATRKTRR